MDRVKKGFAARIHNNIISCLAGQALIVTASGHISILDNNLTSYEYKEQPILSNNNSDKVLYGFIFQMKFDSTSCMFVHNLDTDSDLNNSSLIMVKGNVITMISKQIPQVTHTVTDVDSTYNYGVYQINSVYILSDYGSILLSDNQFVMKLANILEIIPIQDNYTSKIINVKTETFFKNIQACGNFFKENFLNTSPTGIYDIDVVLRSYVSFSESKFIITSNIALNPYYVSSNSINSVFANNIDDHNIVLP